MYQHLNASFIRVAVHLRRGLAIAGVVFSVIFPAHAGAAADLIREGEARCGIVLDAKASGSEQLAARELKTYFHKVTGADIAIESGTAPMDDRLPIYLVTPENEPARRFGLEDELKKLSDEGFLTRITPTEIVIAARKPIGVLYGTYTFIEDHLGVRWFMPGEEGEYVPKKSSVSVENGRIARNPRFDERRIAESSQKTSVFYHDTWEWMARNKMNLRVNAIHWKNKEHAEWLKDRGATTGGGGHILANFVPDEEYFDTHPEYFALVRGERKKSGGSVGKYGYVAQRCLSRPEVVNLGVRYIENFLATVPRADGFLIGNNDGGGWCECADCVAMSDPGELKRGRVSTYFFKYINEVARRVLEKQPDAYIYAWAYQNFRDAPKNINLDPRLSVQFCTHGRCYRHALDDESCPTNKVVREMMATWKAYPNRKGVFEYYNCFAGGTAAQKVVLYVPLEEIITRDIRFLASQGYTFWRGASSFVDGDFPAAFDYPAVRESWRARFQDLYIATRLLWNPDHDLEAIKQEMADGFFGKASKPMKAYRDLLIKTWQEAPGHFVYGTPSIMLGRTLTDPGVEKALLGYLREAEKAVAGDPIISKRVAFEKEQLKSVWIEQAKLLQQNESWAEVNALKRAEPIVVDGVLAEPDWKTARITSGFHAGLNQPAREQTSVRILYDDDAVYFGIEAFDSNVDQLKAQARERDDRAIWGDDTLEIFLEPNGLDDSYYQIAVNPKGVFYDSRCVQGGFGDPGVQLPIEISTRVLKDRWVLEARIPAKAIETEIRKAGIWKVNVARSRKTTQSSETSSWSDGGFHPFSSFRSVLFGEEPPLLTNGGFEEVVTLDTEKKRARHLGSKSPWHFGQNPPLLPYRWSLHEQTDTGVLTMETQEVYSGRYAAKIENGWFFQIFPSADGERYEVSFQAKGDGQLTLRAFFYGRNEEGRRHHVKTVRLDQFELSQEWTKHVTQIRPDLPGVTEIGLAFCMEGTLLVDDVLAQKLED